MRVYLFALAIFHLSAVVSAAQTCGEPYTVQRGDTLSTIAESALGSILDYELIHEANQEVLGRNPNSVEVGLTIYIPCKGEPLTPVEWSVLPSPGIAAMFQARGRVQMLDIRPEKEIRRAFIEGAVWVPYAQWRGPPEDPGTPPSAAELNLIIGKAGLQLERPIIIIHTKGYSLDAGRAAYVYWLLKSMGAQQLALMDGGFAAWTAAGLPVAGAPAQPQPYAAAYAIDDSWRASAEEVAAIVAGEAEGWLLDARPQTVFRQIDRLGEIVPTTLPGAVNAPVEAAFRTVAEAGDADEARAEVTDYLSDVAVEWGQAPVVIFDATGELSALNWFYASELAGRSDVKLYPESTRGWQEQGGELVGGAQPRG